MANRILQVGIQWAYRDDCLLWYRDSCKRWYCNCIYKSSDVVRWRALQSIVKLFICLRITVSTVSIPRTILQLVQEHFLTTNVEYSPTGNESTRLTLTRRPKTISCYWQGLSKTYSSAIGLGWPRGWCVTWMRTLMGTQILFETEAGKYESWKPTARS
jgi:hypothetical protein